MTVNAQKPDFAELSPFLAEWGLPHSAERVARRAGGSMKEIHAFHEAMLPRLEEVINYLNNFAVAEIPTDDMALAYAALAMCEIDNPVRWGEVNLSSGYDVLAMKEKKTLYDNRIP